MSSQNISDYIDCIAYKKLSAVEIDSIVSNQHELNGVHQLKGILGSDSTKKINFRTSYAYLSDEEDDCISKEGTMTWYDARANNPKRSEFRLYYDRHIDFSSAKPGDSLYLIRRTDGSMITLICEKGSDVESQVNWLFDLSKCGDRFDIKEVVKGHGISYATNMVMNLIGVDTFVEGDIDIDILLGKYSSFPSSAEFSEFTRSFIDIDPIAHPDDALVAWLNKEDIFFKALERNEVISTIGELAEGLKMGEEEIDLVNRFISASLSFQNRRKSRAGLSFEHHLKALFDANRVSYSWQKITENNRKPDFIMPSIEMYHDPSVDSSKLTMLAAKTTCKERWTEMIREAERIDTKHLATIEPAISTKQLDVMVREKVQLVVPESIRIESYPKEYLDQIWNIEHFIKYVLEKQEKD